MRKRDAIAAAGRGLFGDRAGVVVLEYALVAPMIFFLLFGLFDLGLYGMTGVLIQDAVLDGARLVWTGQAQKAADGAAAFRSAVCARLEPLVPCGSVVFDVAPFPSFSAIPTGVTVDGNGNMVSRGFAPGLPNDIVVARVSYLYPFFTPRLLPLGSGTMGTQLIVAVSVFENEPYDE